MFLCLCQIKESFFEGLCSNENFATKSVIHSIKAFCNKEHNHHHKSYLNVVILGCSWDRKVSDRGRIIKEVDNSLGDRGKLGR